MDDNFLTKESSDVKFKHLIEHLDGIFWEADATSFNFSYISPQVEKLLGYTAQEWMAVPGFWQDHIHPNERERIVSNCHSQTQQLKDHVFDYRMKTKSGEYIWLNDRVKVHVKNNKPYKLTGLMVDVTNERNQKEEAKQESALIRELIDNLPSLFFLFDESGNFLHFNDALLEHSEYTKEEVESLTPKDFFTGADVPKVERAIKTGFFSGMASVEANFTSKSGESTPYLFMATKFRYKGKDCLLGTGLDISNQRTLENEIRSSERRFKTMIQDGTDMIAILDTDANYLYASPSAEAVLGMNASNFLGKSVFDFIYQEDIPKVRDTLFSLPFTHRIRLEPFRFKDANGDWRGMDTVVTNLLHDPAVGGFVANSRDITEEYFRRKIESLEKEMLELVLEKDIRLIDVLNAYLSSLERIFPKMKTCVAIVKNNGLNALSGPSLSREFFETLQRVPIGINRGSCGTAAYLKKRIIAKNVYEDESWEMITHLPDRFGFKACWSQPIINASGKVTATFACYYDEVREPDEHESYALDRAEILLSLLFSKFDYFEELEKSKERFEIVSRATNDAIWDYEVAENRLYWGPGFQSLFGYDLDNTQPSLEFLVSLIHPEDRDKILGEIKAYMNGDVLSEVWYKEYRLKKADGEYAYVTDKAIFIRDAEGRAIRALGAMSDISSRKEYEQSLKKLNEELECKVKELAITNEELEQFAYVASHDLQEPLRMVDSFMGLLERKYNNQLDEKARQYIFFASDGAKRMRRIILDLLDYSRVGRISGELELIDTCEVVTEACSLLKNMIDEKKAEIHIEGLPLVHSFKPPLLQVFQNLISNALKYARDGIPPCVSIGGSESDKEWKFWVKDNGIGIKEEYHEKIFVIFQRLHASQEYSGNGIGLAIIKKIITNLGGDIWVHSCEGQGSVFYFTISKS